MIDYQSILAASPNGVLATQDGNSVRTRVFQCLFTEGNKGYFCTSTEKPVYAQLTANPQVSFCTYPQNFTPVVSINGPVVFVQDTALKARALDENPGIKAIYETPDNPIFAIFYIDTKEVETFSFADGPKTYTV